MNTSYIILMLICFVAVIVLLANMVIAGRLKYSGLRWILITMYAFSMLRYFTLAIYGDSPSLEQLDSLKYCYMTTLIGLSIPTILAIWYITPHLREKKKYLDILIFFTPWIAFNLYTIISQPTQIISGENFGYILILNDAFRTYLPIVQGLFVGVIILMCFIGIIVYKNPVIRSQYLFLIIAQVGLALDGMTIINYMDTRLFHPFTVSEIIAFLAVYYAFLSKPLDLKKA